jgi:hypothetical protein
MVERDLPIPRISFDREFEVRVPNLVAKQPIYFEGGYVGIKAPIGIGGATDKVPPSANEPIGATIARKGEIARAQAPSQLFIRT